MMRAGRVTVRIQENDSARDRGKPGTDSEFPANGAEIHVSPVRVCFEVLLDVGDVLAGDGGFVHVGVDFEHLLEVLEGGIEFGDAAGFHGLGHEGESEGVVGEGIFGVVGEGLLAIGDGGVEIGGFALAFADAVPGHVVIVVPDVAFGDALLAAHADQRAEHIVIQLTG